MEFLKKGKDWTACYDSDYGRYLGRLGYASPQGSEHYIYAISKDVFDLLGTSAREFDNNELIQDEGTLLLRYENTRYGTMGPESKEYESGADEAWERAYQRSMNRLEALAEAGNLLALRTWLGLNRHTYSWHKDYEKTQQKIRRYLIKAAESGLRSAQAMVAGFYCFGESVDINFEVDLQKGVYWSIKYLENENIEEPQDPTVIFNEGVYSFNMGKTNWSPEEQCEEGLSYYWGDRVEQSYEKALYWFALAAARGNACAQNAIGYCYLKGLGLEEDKDKARLWFTKAAEQGDKFAVANLKILEKQ